MDVFWQPLHNLYVQSFLLAFDHKIYTLNHKVQTQPSFLISFSLIAWYNTSSFGLSSNSFMNFFGSCFHSRIFLKCFSNVGKAFFFSSSTLHSNFPVFIPPLNDKYSTNIFILSSGTFSSTEYIFLYTANCLLCPDE